MKSTRAILAPVLAAGVADKDTVRFTVAPGETRVTDDGIVVPPLMGLV
jgi:hypothetical protein